MGYAVFDKHNQWLVAFPNEQQAIDFARTIAKCRGAYVKEVKIILL